MKYEVNIKVEGDEELKTIKIDFINQNQKLIQVVKVDESVDQSSTDFIPKKSENKRRSNKVKQITEDQPIPPEMNMEF